MFKTNSITTKFYLINFLQLLGNELTGTILVIYLLSKGLNLYDTNILLIIFYIVIFVFEIPTGVIADLYGRKISTVLGLILYTISLIIFIFSNSFMLFVISEVIAGIAATLQSGAIEAWAVDSLKHEKNSLSLEELFSKSFSYRNLGGIICGFLASYLASINLSLPWIASIIITLLTIAICWIGMNEPYFKRSENISLKKSYISMKNIANESIHVGLKNKYIFIILLIGILIQFANSSGNSFQQARLVGLFGGEVWIMGWIKALYSIFMILGSLSIGYLKKNNISSHIIVALACFFIGFWQIMSGYFNSFLPVLLTFLIYEFGRGMYGPAYSSYLNSRIPSDKRATILSFSSLTSEIGMILGLFITGYIGKSFNNIQSNQLPIQISWIICGIFAIIASIISYNLLKEK